MIYEVNAVSSCIFVSPSQKDHERLEKLSQEMQAMEEMLQEERMERVKLEVELGREKDCNRVREAASYTSQPTLYLCLNWQKQGQTQYERHLDVGKKYPVYFQNITQKSKCLSSGSNIPYPAVF